MNYYIEKHDMEIILDALEFLNMEMRTIEQHGEDIEDIYGYSIEYVDSLYESLLNSGEPTWDMK